MWIVANFVILFMDGFHVAVSIGDEWEWLFLHTAFWGFRNFRNFRLRRKHFSLLERCHDRGGVRCLHLLS
jgi:hypothetical protein